MKTNKLIFFATLLLLIAGLYTACKEDDNTPDENINPESISIVTQVEEEQLLSEIFDVSDDDVEGSIINILGGGQKSVMIPPCNAVIHTQGPVNDTMITTITYDGLSCNGQWSREGKIEVRRAQNTPFIDPGTVIRITYIDYSVTNTLTEKTIVINGTKTLTNVTGGLVRGVGTNGITSVTRRVEGSLQVRFGNETTRSWTIARERKWTGTQGALVLTVKGIGESQNHANLTAWGVNRAGEEFLTSITTPVVYKQTCDWKPVAGVKVHTLPADEKVATVTFGYNNNNESIGVNDCPERFRVDWQKGTLSGTRFIPLR